ncbi:gliding motility-associated C-terminal domain-containing protein [Cellulophaga sp. HaHaR_3_176]|uniref:Ig-like domain-containing protein n=1 Tax=Cellulophaga sp. HaHaR_3_176 TaxID=1942464 RepID=UPI001C200686|nr:gliding motility-associated C-terminal domain-containing protein [Cellulophaga sp. HaHaR_3_176]QWX84817.1 gliding motility-associated C-terminal domain-containing protein [Cellulophaga sp. HaHaR_3_176]
MDTFLLSGKKISLGLLITFLLSTLTTFSQTRNYAEIVSSESNVDNSANSIDENLNTSALVKASSGALLGLGAYSGHLELQYPNSVPANTTSFVKINSEDEILPFLLGGNLGNLLADVGGVVLLGNQQFLVEAKDGTTTVLQGNSGNPNDFSTDSMRAVVDQNGDYFLALTPNTAYDNIRLTNSLGSLVGLGNTKGLEVFGSYYGDGIIDCGTPSFTSFDGNGITLDLLNLGGAGVTNPENAIDNDINTASELSLGLIAVAGDVEQTFYFDSLSNATDQVYIVMAIDPSLLQLGLADNISVEGSNGTDQQFTESLSSLLDLDVLGLLQSGDATILNLNPGESVDKVTVNMSSLLNVALVQNLKIFDVFIAPGVPVIDASASDLSVCINSSANLVANAQDNTSELRWYDAESGGNLLATVNSGDTFTTPVLNSNQTYYVSAATIGCINESPRVEVPVNVVAIPTADDIMVTGNEFPLCSSSDVVLHPFSAIDGEFLWYFDANKVNQITDGMVVSGVTYSISSTDGTLTVTGLDQSNSPYTYYVGIKESSAGCENVPGDLKEVEVTVVDSNTSVAVDLSVDSSMLSLNDLFEFFNGDNSANVTGSVSGDANAGDIINVLVNNVIYTGALDANLNFDIALDGIDLAADSDNVLDVFIEGGVCTDSGDVSISLPDLVIDDVLQVFCASDNPTLADIVLDSNISLFNLLDSDVAVSLDTPLVDGDVFFAGILNIPTSILDRVQITIEFTTVPPPTTTSIIQNFCITDLATVADIQVNESEVVFYDAETGGTMLTPSVVLTDGIYYVATIENGCESTERLAVTVGIINVPAPTTTSTNQDFCESNLSTVADIQVNETEIIFYDAQTGGNAIDPSNILVDGTYYAANIQNGCESTERLAITVTILEGVTATITGEKLEACISRPYTYTTEDNHQNYSWTITGGTISEGGTTTDNFVSVLWTDLEDTSIRVTYENTVGCGSIVSEDVTTRTCGEVLGEEFGLLVYNEFTPNNDGYNDYFEIKGILDYSSSIQVYNRNGNLVFETTNYQNNWDGIASVSGILNPGEELPSGTYYYVINLPEIQRNLMGWLQLVR